MIISIVCLILLSFKHKRLRGNEQIDLSGFYSLLSTICEFLLIINNNKEEKMKKIKVEDKTNDNEIFQIIGILLIGFAVVDFAMSWMGTNLTAFLGPLSQFTPLAAGLTGAMFLNIGNKSE